MTWPMPGPGSHLEYAGSPEGSIWWRDEAECREVNDMTAKTPIYVRLVTTSAPWVK